MIRTDSVPEATAPAEHHADFLELCALRSESRSVSFQTFISDLRICNSTEAVADSADPGQEPEFDEQDEALAQAAFDELDERRRNFGDRAAFYPFEISGTSLNLKEDAEQSLYTFLALLSWFGKDAGPNGWDGEKVFEDICAKACESYFGAQFNGRVRSVVFGFPRRVLPRSFGPALDELCASIGEGAGHHKGRPRLPDQKDAKLDIVSWIEFHDRRQGKLISFGQCATGRNWTEKITELPSPDRWCGHWMSETPTVLPIRAFFVPHRIERDNWSHSCTFGGILYDRCRIASLVDSGASELRSQWSAWSSHVLDCLRETTG